MSALIITGTSGSGKSTTSREITVLDKNFQRVKAITTRARRSDDTEEEYDYMNKERFNELKDKNELLICTEYKNEFYGITFQSLNYTISLNKIPIIILSPKSYSELYNKQGSNLFSIFLDAADDLLNERLSKRGINITNEIISIRAFDRNFISICSHLINDIDKTKAAKKIIKLWFEYYTRDI